MSRGGKRPGAGRPRGEPRESIKVRRSVAEQIREYARRRGITVVDAASELLKVAETRDA